MLMLLLMAVSISCTQQNNSNNQEAEVKSSEDDGPERQDKQSLEGLEKAVFASGCFWCVEAIFQEVKGVKEAISGYAGGTEKDPTYEEVSSGQTSHAEAVQVYYDPQVVDYSTLLKVFFGSHDPTTLNRQGPDIGPQYRSAIFYVNEEQKRQTEAFIGELEASGEFKEPITTEVSRLTRFYPAEDYHQEYEAKNPDDPYVRKVSVPRIERFKKRFPELLK